MRLRRNIDLIGDYNIPLRLSHFFQPANGTQGRKKLFKLPHLFYIEPNGQSSRPRLLTNDRHLSTPIVVVATDSTPMKTNLTNC